MNTVTKMPPRAAKRRERGSDLKGSRLVRNSTTPKDESNGYCPVCQRQRLLTRDSFNQMPHLVMTFFTCGLWLPILFLAMASYNPPWRCQTCGQLIRNRDRNRQPARPSPRTARQTAPARKKKPWWESFTQDTDEDGRPRRRRRKRSDGYGCGAGDPD